jgi:endo-1,4-beta-xylanase
MRSLTFVSRVFLSALVAAGSATVASHAQTIYNNGSGFNNGYYYVLYSVGGSATMTFPSASKYPGNFQVNWYDVTDVVGGKGWITGSNRTVGYSVAYLQGYNNVSLYGWTTNPLVEYYICEFGSVAAGTYKGSVSSDGHTYNTYEHLQVNQPSILGTATFEQYLDNWGGSSVGSNHAITTGNHFNHWQNLGMPLGAFSEMIFVGEAWGGATGEINATIW